MNNPRVLMIGFDSAEPELLDRWCNDGTLPNLKALRDRSAWGEVRYPSFLGSGAMWPSLFTGVSPAEHGRYFYSQIKPNSYEQYNFSRTQLQGKPIWQRLSEEGKRVAVIDAPQLPLDKNINGIHVVDWLAHDRHYDTPPIYPAELREDILSRFGVDEISRCDHFDQSVTGLTELYTAIRDRVTRKTTLVSELLAKEAWDLFCVVYHDPHCIGHQSWHIHDPHHPRHDPELAKALEDPVKKIYIELDKAVGKLMRQVGKDTCTILFSGPGMGPNYTGNHLLEAIISHLDRVPPSVSRRSMIGLRKLWSKFPRSIRFLGPLRRNVQNMAQTFESHNRANCSFYQVLHNDISGAIRLNVAGREPQGHIKRGAHFDSVVASLKKDLLEIVNLDTGEPLVHNVCVTADYIDSNAPHFDNMPDLFVEWNRNAPIRRIGSNKIGIIKRDFVARRTGDHTPNAVLFASGPGIDVGRLDRPVDLHSICSSISSRLGVSFDQAAAPPDPRIVGS